MADEEKMHEGHEFHYGNWTTTNDANKLLKKFNDVQILSKYSTDFLMETVQFNQENASGLGSGKKMAEELDEVFREFIK